MIRPSIIGLMLSVLLAAILLAGCGTAPDATTATSTPVPTRTRRVWPTATSSPTIDPTLRARRDSVNATEDAWIYVSVPATQTAAATELAPFLGGCGSSSFLISPDGNWLAQDCAVYSPYQNWSFEVTNRSGGETIRVSYEEIFSDQDRPLSFASDYPYNMGELTPFHWSPDNRYVYFLRSANFGDSVVPYGNFRMNYDPNLLYRLDVQSGRWSQTIPAANYFSFSPTERRLVTIRRSELTILDLNTGATNATPIINALAAGYVVWSEDGLRLFFAAVKGPENFSEFIFDYEIYELDVTSNTLTTLQYYARSDAIVYPIRLTSDNVLVIQSEKAPSGHRIEVSYFDLATHQFVDPTPTP